MHELPVTKRIFQIVLKHALRSNVQRVQVVNREIGALSDLRERGHREEGSAVPERWSIQAQRPPLR